MFFLSFFFSQALPPNANSREEVIALINEQRSGMLREVRCGACGRAHPVLEVALRPSDWLRPLDIADDLTMQRSSPRRPHYVSRSSLEFSSLSDSAPTESGAKRAL